MKLVENIRLPKILTDPLEINKLEQLKKELSHVLWIGGATDAGKTTVAQILAERHNLQVYNYDKYDVSHHQVLIVKNIRLNSNKTMEETWIDTNPVELLNGCIQGFMDRFPLMIEDLLAMPKDTIIIAEGFGIIPELIDSMLTHPSKAVYLFPTASFKYESMNRRKKLSGLGEKAEIGRRNLFIRDILLIEYIQEQVKSRSCTAYLVDGSKSPAEIAALAEKHFETFL